MPETKQPKLYAIPAGTKSSICNGPHCGATIYFVMNPRSGRPMPLSCDVEGGRPPGAKIDPAQADIFGAATDARDGRGALHFTNCPDAESFSGRNRR